MASTHKSDGQWRGEKTPRRLNHLQKSRRISAFADDLEKVHIDVVFQGGKKHSNHGGTVEKMVVHMVHKIRIGYRPDVPIVFRMDAGFFDQKLFQVFEDLNIGYFCTGKL